MKEAVVSLIKVLIQFSFNNFTTMYTIRDLINYYWFYHGQYDLLTDNLKDFLKMLYKLKHVHYVFIMYCFYINKHLNNHYLYHLKTYIFLF